MAQLPGKTKMIHARIDLKLKEAAERVFSRITRRP
jgi:antitoxin component of RelBE/YafQ-DinJ toxin-antitoxin module